MDYKSVWWRMFNAFDATEWSNALLLVQLLFSLPASNGKLERVFSTVNVIKVNKRSRLDNDSLYVKALLSNKSKYLKAKKLRSLNRT